MRRLPLIVLALLVVTILAGQTIAYYIPDKDPTIKTTVEGDSVQYTVDSSTPAQCTEIHLTGTSDITQFYVYYDDDYSDISGDVSLKSAYFFLKKNFDMCSTVSVDMRDAQEIAELVGSGAHDFGLIFFSGALPDTIYNGTMDSPIVDWLKSGGHIIWSGDLFGRYVSSEDRTDEVPDYHTAVAEKLFGEGCSYNDSEDQTWGDERANGYLTGATGFYYANTTYGFDNSTLSVPYIEAGYTDGTYTSVTVMKIGTGTLCHFGDFAPAQESKYLAHAAVIGLTYTTAVEAYSTTSARFYGHTSTFEDSADEKHLVILHDIDWFKVWTYDRAEEKFV